MDLDVVLRTSLLLVAACVAARLLRRAAPSTRHLLWHAAIMIVLLAPALAPLAPTFNVPMVRTVPLVRTVQVPSALGTSAHGTLGNLGARSTQDPSGTVRTIGTLGALAVGVWFAFGWLSSGLSVRRSKPAPTAWIYDARQVCARIGGTRRPRSRANASGPATTRCCGWAPGRRTTRRCCSTSRAVPARGCRPRRSPWPADRQSKAGSCSSSATA